MALHRSHNEDSSDPSTDADDVDGEEIVMRSESDTLRFALLGRKVVKKKRKREYTRY